MAVFAVSFSLTGFASVVTSRSLNSSGQLNVTAGLEVFADANCLFPLSSIDWGSMSPGNNVTRVIYVKNTGEHLSLTLGLQTSGWVPVDAEDFLSLVWNQEGVKLMPGQVVAAVLTLRIPNNVVDITNFNVQITIIGVN